MAKGVEDTAFYRYVRLLALNDVGGDPGRFGISVERVPRGQPRARASASRATCSSPRRTTPSARATCARGSARCRRWPSEWAARVRALARAARATLRRAATTVERYFDLPDAASARGRSSPSGSRPTSRRRCARPSAPRTGSSPTRRTRRAVKAPMIGCECGTCRSTDPRDRRSRASILHPDRRRAVGARRHDARSAHAGAGARRASASTRSSTRTATPITSWGSTKCAASTCCRSRRFPVTATSGRSTTCGASIRYIFDADTPRGGGIPQVVARARSRGSSASARRRSCRCRCCTASRTILGYRVGSFAYLTDCSAIPDASWPLLSGVRTRDPRRAARAAASDALVGRPGARGRRAARARARVLHAHVPRSAARGDLRAAARRRGVGI